MKRTINWARLKRRVISISIMLVLVLEIVPGTTLAFYTTNGIATNVITAGNIEIEGMAEVTELIDESIPLVGHTFPFTIHIFIENSCCLDGIFAEVPDLIQLAVGRFTISQHPFVAPMRAPLLKNVLVFDSLP